MTIVTDSQMTIVVVALTKIYNLTRTAGLFFIRPLREDNDDDDDKKKDDNDVADDDYVDDNDDDDMNNGDNDTDDEAFSACEERRLDAKCVYRSLRRLSLTER